MQGRRPRRSRSTRLRVGPWTLTIAAVLLAGCGGVGFIGTTASSFLRRVRESDDPNIRYAAINRLGDPSCYEDEGQKADAAKTLAESYLAGKDSIASRAAICRTLGQIGHPEALTALRKAALDPEPIVRAEACRALGKVGTEEDATILARIMTTDTSRDCRVAAIDGLAEMAPEDPRIGISLVEGMKNPDPAIRAASYEALQQTTGQDLGFEIDKWEELATSRLGDDAPIR